MFSSLITINLCILCAQRNDSKQIVCSFCNRLIQQYAMPLSIESSASAINQVITAYRYEEPLRTLLHTFKYHQGLYLTSFLVHLMLQAPFDSAQTDCFIPVPMHRKRLQQRGFNQAAHLAQRLSRICQRPCINHACQKIKNTAPQAGLNAHQRQINLKNAFVSRTLPYKHITLVDDLYTTGSTANEIATVLKDKGAKRVDIWCCARATLTTTIEGL